MDISGMAEANVNSVERNIKSAMDYMNDALEKGVLISVDAEQDMLNANRQLGLALLTIDESRRVRKLMCGSDYAW